MKKTLIALAALASTAAFAQSSVTLYGVVDAGVYKQGSTTAATVDGNGGSRLGVKGEEDLGGGLSATFMIESAVNLAGGDTATTAGTVLGGNRGATVGLKGSFGALEVGARNLSTAFYTMAAIDPSGMANYGVAGLTAADARNQKPAVQYTAPTMNGLTVRASYVMADNNAAGVGATNHLGATYANGPLTLAAYRVDLGTTNDKMYGAKYDLGVAAVHVSNVNNAGTKQTNYGLSAPIGAAVLFVDYKNAKTGADTTVIGGQYNLSKSTFAYGAVSKTDNAQTKTLVGLRKNF